MKTIPRWLLVSVLTLFAVPGRADAPPGRFVAANGTVSDTMTLLEWQREDDDVDRNWANARTYCTDLSHGGSNDWRLPTVKELQTLVEHGRLDPSIDPVFTSTEVASYWTATPLAGSATSAWVVTFNVGYATEVSVSTPFRVRCVR